MRISAWLIVLLLLLPAHSDTWTSGGFVEQNGYRINYVSVFANWQPKNGYLNLYFYPFDLTDQDRHGLRHGDNGGEPYRRRKLVPGTYLLGIGLKPPPKTLSPARVTDFHLDVANLDPRLHGTLYAVSRFRYVDKDMGITTLQGDLREGEFIQLAMAGEGSMKNAHFKWNLRANCKLRIDQ